MFYFCHLKKLVRPETFGPHYVHYNVLTLCFNGTAAFLMVILSVCILLLSLNPAQFCPQTLFLCYPKETSIVSTNNFYLSDGDVLCFSLCENCF